MNEETSDCWSPPRRWRSAPGRRLAKKQLVIVVKGLDNPFFEAINQGCQKWNKRERQLGIRVLLHRPGIDLR